jgi:hypothetical protein
MQIEPCWRSETVYTSFREPDRNVDARIYQLTSVALVSHNIYGETRYTTADGSRLALLRGARGADPELTELWIGELPENADGDWCAPRLAFVCDGVWGLPAAQHYGNRLVLIRALSSEERVLSRFDMQTLDLEDVCPMQDLPPVAKPVGTVSPDGRHYVSIQRLQDHRYGLFRVDLETGAWECFHEHDDIANPHLQYEPGEGKTLLVQWNRPPRDGSPGGISLYTVDAATGEPTYLPVGPPYTGNVTGHECWIGRTGRIALTLVADPAYRPVTGVMAMPEVHVMQPGDEQSRCLFKGVPVVHIAVSDDGRFFVVDDVRYGRLYVGSIETGRVLPLCESHTSTSGQQPSHAHPYVTPGNRFVIFNSDRTGLPQVYAAEIPAGFLDALTW